jgi:hypothetical protein
MADYDFRQDTPGIRGIIQDSSMRNNPKISFWYVPPEISEDWKSNWKQIEIIGRSAPIWGYASTSARSVTLNLTFFADAESKLQVFDKIRFIQSFLLPDYVTEYMRRPHMATCIIGTLINITGVIEQVNVKWRAPYSGQGEVEYAMLAEVGLTINEVMTTPVDVWDWRGGINISDKT